MTTFLSLVISKICGFFSPAWQFPMMRLPLESSCRQVVQERPISVSGSSIMITSASAAAVATSVTFSPASSALARDALPSRRPTRTSTPDSLRFSACACPCEPYPRIATLRPAMMLGSASFS